MEEREDEKRTRKRTVVGLDRRELHREERSIGCRCGKEKKKGKGRGVSREVGIEERELDLEVKE